MISVYVREQKRYTPEELSGLLRCGEEKERFLIRKLKEFGILKAVRGKEQKDLSELTEEEIEIADAGTDEEDLYYVFTFVGVVVAAGCVLKCYPKYLRRTPRPVEQMRQILKVLSSAGQNEQVTRMLADTGEGKAFNLLAVLLFLMQDYFENGEYRASEDVIESNGTGEILWEKTINETFMFLSEGRPYYTDLQTKRRVADEYDYFTRLHRCILTRASRELKEADLLDLFEITEADLTEETLEDFGEKDEILYRIEKKLNTQFNTRKQMLLKTMYAYIARRESLLDREGVSLYGTNSFNLVWEGVCADVMNNLLEKKLGELKLPAPLAAAYGKNTRLIELIPRPFWTASGIPAKDTLIPDLITVSGDSFLIFDAKYYTPVLKEGQPPSGQPGIESVTKQYLYQLAYSDFIRDHGFRIVRNCFLLPTEGGEVVSGGEVRLDLFKEIGLQPIQVRFLPATRVFDLYLRREKMRLEELGL